MKKHALWVIAAGVLAAGVAWALVPLLDFTVYGQARDRWGWPCVEGGEVICRIDGRECARTTVRYDMGPAVNFSLRIPLDDGIDPRYDPKAGRIGERMILTVKDTDGEFPIIEADIPPVGLPAESARIIVTAGTDSDHDGLPDEWELWIVQASFQDGITNVTDVAPGDDFDGDGVSNLREFLAGTFPDMAGDFFFVEELLPERDGKLGLMILSVPGKTYRVQSATNLAAIVWEPSTFTTDPSGPTTLDFATGDGGTMVLYVAKPASELRRCYRLTVE
jgi:hypothetical protein